MKNSFLIKAVSTAMALIVILTEIPTYGKSVLAADGRKDISQCSIYVGSYCYNNCPVEAKPKITDGSNILKEWQDYTVTCSNNVDAGDQAVAVITGIGDYAGSVTRNFSITGYNISGNGSVYGPWPQTYTGSRVTPYIEAATNGRMMTLGKDYIVTYLRNIKVGEAKAFFSGLGAYKGSVIDVAFDIEAPESGKENLVNADVSVSDVIWTGKQATPTVTVTMNGTQLREGTDYTVYGSRECDDGLVGTHAITVSGTGSYTGSKNATFNVNPVDISNAVYAPLSPQAWTGKGIVPTVVLTYNGKRLYEAMDYNLAFEKNVDNGTACAVLTGIQNYTGTIRIPFEILKSTAEAKSLKNAEIADVPNQKWTGVEIMPEPSVTYGGKALVKGQDFSYSYKNNNNKGTATVTAIGMGNFRDSISTTFRITENGPTPSPDEAADWIRLSGANRYETAAEIAKKAFPQGAREVILVSGQNFPDALSAAGLAGVRKVPLLITQNVKLAPPILKLIKSWGVTDVTIVGGSNVVTQNVIDSLVRDCAIRLTKIHRIAGKNRYKTAEEVEKVIQESGGNTKICCLAKGTVSADVLSVSPWAYKNGWPILFADVSGNISSSTMTILKKYSEVYILGGPDSVSSSIEENLSNAKRLCGNNRYETSVKIASEFCKASGSYNYTAFANGADGYYADALTGSMLCGKHGSPVLLENGKAMSTAVRNLLKNQYAVSGSGVDLLYVFGDSKSMSDTLVNSMKALW